MAAGRGRTLYRLDQGSAAFQGFDIGGGLPKEADNPVLGMYRDPAGILWLCAANGLVRFDPSTGVATNYPQRPFRVLAQDGAGKMWLRTSEGLNSFDPETGAFALRRAAQYFFMRSEAAFFSSAVIFRRLRAFLGAAASDSPAGPSAAGFRRPASTPGNAPPFHWMNETSFHTSAGESVRPHAGIPCGRPS